MVLARGLTEVGTQKPDEDAAAKKTKPGEMPLEEQRRKSRAILRNICIHVAAQCGAGTGDRGLFEEYIDATTGGGSAAVVALMTTAMSASGMLELSITQGVGALTDRYGKCGREGRPHLLSLSPLCRTKPKTNFASTAMTAPRRGSLAPPPCPKAQLRRRHAARKHRPPPPDGLPADCLSRRSLTSVVQAASGASSSIRRTA